MHFSVITLFPEMFSALQSGITGRALNKQQISLNLINPRDFATDKHQTVDDKPYGGGPGMVMLAEPLYQAITAAKAAAPTPAKVIYLSPQGKGFTQKMAENAVESKSSFIFIAGRYEGIDERLITECVDEEWSIGDYILTGGELPAMVVIDTITRLLPDVLGDSQSHEQDSITTGLLKYPQYTRPEIWHEASVPDVLLGGHHKNIAKWRLKQSLGKTWTKRKDLLEERELNKEEKALLAEFIAEKSQ